MYEARETAYMHHNVMNTSYPPTSPPSSHQLIRLITELEEAGGEGGRGAHSKLKERLTHLNTTAAAMVKVRRMVVLFVHMIRKLLIFTKRFVYTPAIYPIVSGPLYT